MSASTAELLAITSIDEAARSLSDALGADDVVAAPDPATADPDPEHWAQQLTQWRTANRSERGPGSQVLVAALSASPPLEVHELSSDDWRRRFEMPFTLWFTALQLAADLCADGGAIAVVLRRPTTLDCVGHGPAVALADSVANAARSLAFGEGPRGVRVNAVTWPGPDAFDVDGLPGAAPPLAGAPGSIAVEVAGAVRMLMSELAVGCTGTTVRVDGGRSWV